MMIVLDIGGHVEGRKEGRKESSVVGTSVFVVSPIFGCVLYWGEHNIVLKMR
jgi:hypothetical protein